MSFSEVELAIVRRAYAKQILAAANVSNNPALEAAFGSVEREHFLGPAPWQVSGGRGYRTLTSDDPVVVYQDINFALSSGRGVNNGSPLLHAIWLNALGSLEGARVAHIGAGTGTTAPFSPASSANAARFSPSNMIPIWSSGPSAICPLSRMSR